MDTYVERALTGMILERLRPNHVVIILGTRRVGKTFFLNKFIGDHIKEPFLFINGEDMAVSALIANRTIENYKRLLGNTKVLIIDEAQQIPDIGLALKLMVDHIPGLKVIATGSSVFDLSNKLGEPLTGRKTTLYMFPFAQMELNLYENPIETKARLEERMIYGYYPEQNFLSSYDDKANYLNELVNSYLLKDLLAFEGMRNSQKVFSLLQLISYQIGKEVSLEELGRKLGISRNTVEKYLDLLTKVFVIYRLPGFSRNLRTEITKTSRWYFYDNGIRNAIINNFKTLGLRNDQGELWENYLFAERLKFMQYTNIRSNNYFWRTYAQQEIDWIEDRDGTLHAYEIKWSPKQKNKVPSAWASAYPDSHFNLINSDNYLNWISP